MLSMEEGGADIIELGVPFSDPVADGVAIQETNGVCKFYTYVFLTKSWVLVFKIALQNNTDYSACLSYVQEARWKGLKAPIILMGTYGLTRNCDDTNKLYIRIGYYNPLLSYGEERAIEHAKEAGANGFIVVDLPPEEAIVFREKCADSGYGISIITAIGGNWQLSQIIIHSFNCPVNL